MKFLDVARLNAVTSFLNGRTVGGRRLQARVESYSCKAAGDDKRLHKSLEQRYLSEVAAANGSLPSPLGDLADPHTRRLLVDLICTMNATFPDYDFSALGPDRFRLEHLGRVVNAVNTSLSEFAADGAGFLEELWGAIDADVLLRDAQVYAYEPDLDGDPFSAQGSLWSFNFFFHSREEKKMVFFTCGCFTLAGAQAAGADMYGSDGADDDDAAAEDAAAEDDEEEDDAERDAQMRSHDDDGDALSTRRGADEYSVGADTTAGASTAATGAQSPDNASSSSYAAADGASRRARPPSASSSLGALEDDAMEDA